MIGSAPIGSTPIAAGLTPQAAAAEENVDRGLGAAFQTRAVRSRRHQQALWVAGLAPAQQAVVVPVSAWLARPAQRRRSTKRTLIAVEPLQWQYIAPTVAAILPAPKVIKIDFRRKLQESAPLDYYPPPTGPPSDHGNFDVPFQTRRLKSRKHLTVDGPLHVGPATPPSVPYAATAPQAKKRRRPRQGLFLSGGGAPLYQATSTSAPVYPSFVPTGHHLRRDTGRRLQAVEDAPVYPQAEVTVSADRALTESFQTSRIRSRKLQKAPDVLGASAAAPAPLQFAATVQVKVQKRRRARQGLFLSGGAVIGAPAQPVSAWAAPKQHKQDFKRRLLREPLQLERPSTPPVAPQPPTAWKLATAKYTPAQRHRHLFMGGPLHVDAAPPPTDLTGPEYKVSIKRRRR